MCKFFNIFSSWHLITSALLLLGLSALLLPLVPSLLYLLLPHFAIGLCIGSIDSALLPLLAELVDEHFAAQYGYVYAAAQTAASAAYAFGPLLAGALLNARILTFPSLMHIVAMANLALALLALTLRHLFLTRAKEGKINSKSVSFKSPDVEEEEKVLVDRQ